MLIRRVLTLALLLALLAAPSALAQREPPIAVHFARGATSTTVSGSLSGAGTADYAVEVQAFQTLQLKLTGSNNIALDLYAPGQDTPMNAGGDGQRFSGLLAAPGTYRIHIHPQRAPLRGDEVARYTLGLALR